jgi:hypothetical protein
MKNIKIGIPMSEFEMKTVNGGYVTPSSSCSISGCSAGTHACCNEGSCKCVSDDQPSTCATGGCGQTSCSYPKAASTFEQP